MFESLDEDDPRTGPTLGGPFVLVVLLCGGFAYVLAPLIGAANSGLAAMVFVAGLVIAIAAQWERRLSWVFWTIVVLRMVIDAALIRWVRWTGQRYGSGVFEIALLLNVLINYALLALAPSRNSD